MGKYMVKFKTIAFLILNFAASLNTFASDYKWDYNPSLDQSLEQNIEQNFDLNIISGQTWQVNPNGYFGDILEPNIDLEDINSFYNLGFNFNLSSNLKISPKTKRFANSRLGLKPSNLNTKKLDNKTLKKEDLSQEKLDKNSSLKSNYNIYMGEAESYLNLDYISLSGPTDLDIINLDSEPKKDLNGCQIQDIEDSGGMKHRLDTNFTELNFLTDQGESNLETLESLISEKKNDNKIKCPICLRKVASSSYLIYHMLNLHADRASRCRIEDCNKVVMLNELDEHEKSHAIFDCEYCEKRFILQSHLAEHVKAEHRENNPGCFLYKCPISGCTEFFNSASTLYRHKRDGHSNEPIMCLICSSRFKNIYSLNAHNKRFHNSKNKDYKCGIRGCGDVFFTQNDLKEHKKVHYIQKDIVCKTCGITFSKAYELNSHILTHFDNTFKCPVEGCVFGFRYKSSLKKHIKEKHKESFMYKCRKVGCDQEFKLRSELEAHRKAHVKLKECICPICAKAYTKNNFKRHIKIHGQPDQLDQLNQLDPLDPLDQNDPNNQNYQLDQLDQSDQAYQDAKYHQLVQFGQLTQLDELEQYGPQGNY